MDSNGGGDGPVVLEAEILCLANCSSGSHVLRVFLSRGEQKRILVHKLSVDCQEGSKCVLDRDQRFAVSVSDGDILTFEICRKTGVFKKERYTFSLRGSSFRGNKSKNSTWFECRQVVEGKWSGKHSANHDTRKGSWRIKSAQQLPSSPSTPPTASHSGASVLHNSSPGISVGLSMPQSPPVHSISMFLSLACRSCENGTLRRSKSSSGSESASLAARRAMIVAAPIDGHMSNEVIVALYGGSQLRSRRASLSAREQTPSPSLNPKSETSSSSSSLQSSRESIPTVTTSPGPEPVYITFSDEEEDNAREARGEEASQEQSQVPNNWNTEYQELLEIFAGICNRGSHSRHDTRVVSLELAKLEADFLQNAESYGKIILSELFLPSAKKTIKPVNIGGHLGGQKYIVENAAVMFKVPDASPFLSEKRDFSAAMACANKVAGHELAGIRLLSSYFFDNRSAVRVSLPLACVIDYMGLRLLAMSVLPISPLTLRYGSQNAGGDDRHVVQSDVTLATLLNEMGQSLNLESHRVFDRTSQTEVSLRTPVDLEGHRGFDGRYYLVDTSRVMPPCVLDTSDKACIFFELFRPEAMPFLPALSSDALSRFVSRTSPASEALAEAQERDIFLSTKYLLADYMMEAARKLSEMVSMYSSIDGFDLVAEIHSLGLNVRFLGLLVAAVPKEATLLLRWLYAESLSRVVKNRIRSVLRVQLKHDASGVRSNLTDIVAKELDCIFCFPNGEAWKTRNSWLLDLLAEYRFSPANAALCVAFLHEPTALSIKRIRDDKPSVETPITYVLSLVAKSLAITIVPRVLDAIRSNVRQFDERLQTITYMDIVVGSRVKHLPLIERCSAFTLSQQGFSAQTVSNAKTDYLERAHQAIARALHSCPNDPPLLLLEGEILAREVAILRSELKAGGASSLSVIQAVHSRCITAFERAVENDSSNTTAMMRLAMVYSDFGNHQRAEELFVNALEVNPCDLDALKRYGDFLSGVGKAKEAEPFYLRRQRIMVEQQSIYQSFRDAQAVTQVAPTAV